MARDFDGVDDRVFADTGVLLPLDSPVSIHFFNNVAAGNSGVGFCIGTVPGVSSRCQAHSPFVDSNLYWDYGSSTAGTGEGRISTSYAAYMDKWTSVGLTSEGNGGAFKGIYLDGPLVASFASSDGPETDRSDIAIGNSTNALDPHDGSIAEFAFWDVRLTDAEFAALAKGFSPLLIRPQSLVGYWPLGGRTSPEPDRVGGNNGTLTGTTYADHPRVYRPWRETLVPLTLALPAAYTLDASPGAYTLTGTAASTLAGRVVSADPASYALTGTSATPVAGRTLSADAGSYLVTGTAASTVAARLILASPGSYALTGSAATLVAAVAVPTELPEITTGFLTGPSRGRIAHAQRGRIG